MHVYLFERVQKFLHKVTQVLIFANAHLFLLVQARLHRIQPGVIDRGRFNKNSLPVFVLVLKVGDANLKLIQVQFVLVEVVAADLLNFLRVRLEPVLERLGLVLQMIDRLCHEVVHFIKLARELTDQFFLLLTHLVSRQVPDRLDILLNLRSKLAEEFI